MTDQVYKNKAHQTAFATGKAAAASGESRVAPYGCDNISSLYFRRAWLAGYDSVQPSTKADEQ